MLLIRKDNGEAIDFREVVDHEYSFLTKKEVRQRVESNTVLLVEALVASGFLNLSAASHILGVYSLRDDHNLIVDENMVESINEFEARRVAVNEDLGKADNFILPINRRNEEEDSEEPYFRYCINRIIEDETFKLVDKNKEYPDVIFHNIDQAYHTVWLLNGSPDAYHQVKTNVTNDGEEKENSFETEDRYKIMFHKTLPKNCFMLVDKFGDYEDVRFYDGEHARNVLNLLNKVGRI